MNIDIRNIRSLDYYASMSNIVNQIRQDYNGLDEDKTCKLYSNIVSDKLNENHIPNRIVNTIELGSTYRHIFVIAPYAESYVLFDLTYSQFNSLDPLFATLLEKGYQIVDNDSFNEYLKIVTSGIDEFDYDLSDIYHEVSKTR